MSNDIYRGSTNNQINRKSIFHKWSKSQHSKVKKTPYYVISGVMTINMLTGALLYPDLPKANAESIVSMFQTNTSSAVSSIPYNTLRVVIDGVNQNYDQSPVMQNGSVLVPMRAVFESLGATVKYTTKPNTIDAVKGATRVSLVIGKTTATVDGKTVTLAAPVKIINGSTMVPLRFVNEALGADVTWNPVISTVTISTSGSSDSSSQTTPGATKLNPSKTNKYAIFVPENHWQEVTVYTYTHNGTGEGYSRSNPVKIKVEFGDHTYGAQNQKEYDYIMTNVKHSLDQLFAPGGQYEQKIDPLNGEMALFRQAYKDYKDGVRLNLDKPNDLTLVIKDRNYLAALVGIEEMGVVIDNGLTFEEIMKFQTMKSVLYKYDTIARDPLDASPRSAYDMMYHKITDCDPQSYLTAAILDYMGYNSAAFINSGHAGPTVQLMGKWYSAQGFSLYNDTARTFDQIKALGLRNNGQMLEKPTYESRQ